METICDCPLYSKCISVCEMCSSQCLCFSSQSVLLLLVNRFRTVNYDSINFALVLLRLLNNNNLSPNVLFVSPTKKDSNLSSFFLRVVHRTVLLFCNARNAFHDHPFINQDSSLKTFLPPIVPSHPDGVYQSGGARVAAQFAEKSGFGRRHDCQELPEGAHAGCL